MKRNPVLITLTHLKPFVLASFQLPEVVNYISDELQAYKLENRGFEYKNE
jgi:hypothetical protein